MRLITAAACALFAFPASAQDTSQAVLVLDASGSMWGQIDGKAKITIAQEVIDGLLDDMPATQELGLTAYGHRRKGDCKDIQTLVQPGGDTRDAIRAAVNGIKPKGKTPLSAAVIEAAEILRYTEERATVILVSDGKETCDFDPCEVGKQLEDAGIDFTAHVVGFDITDPKDRAELQCLANETGGTYQDASNAAELGRVLFEVVEAEAEPEPEAITYATTVVAVDELSGNRLSTSLLWTLQQDGSEAVSNQIGTNLKRDLETGAYQVSAENPETGVIASTDFSVGRQSQTVEVIFPVVLPDATVTAPANGILGSTVEVSWTGPDEKNDFIAIGIKGAEGAARWQNLTRTREGNPLELQLPPTPGTYIVSYFLNDRTLALASTEIEVTEAPATVTAPSAATAGETIEVTWTGPDEKNDFIAIGLADAKGAARWENLTRTREGNPLELSVPPTPGTYTITYFLSQDDTPLASASIEVTEAVASITAPETATAGDVIEVSWTGPDEKNDFVAIGLADAKGAARWENFTRTREGNPLELSVPPTPGTYTITYFLSQDDTPLVSREIEVSAAKASVNAPATAAAGSLISVDWNGPDAKNDFIAIGLKDAKGAARWDNFTRTRDGNPSELRVPPAPGTYTVTYFLSQDDTALATTEIEVTAVEASVSAPQTAVAGETITVAWQGPNEKNDFIAIGETGAKGAARWDNYTRTNKGQPLELAVPPRPGSYTITYFLAQDDTPLGTADIEVTAASATLSAPPSAAAGSTLAVEWTGPDYKNDFVSVGKIDATGGARWQAYARTRKGNPAEIKLPDEPGNYVIRYFIAQDDTELTAIPLTIE